MKLNILQMKLFKNIKIIIKTAGFENEEDLEGVIEIHVRMPC